MCGSLFIIHNTAFNMREYKYTSGCVDCIILEGKCLEDAAYRPSVGLRMSHSEGN